MISKQNIAKENIILVGNKPLLSYVKKIEVVFKKNKAQRVIIKSRGKFISKAVDVAELSKNKFLKEENVKPADIKIDSENFKTKEGKKLSVSTLEITLRKS